MSRTESPLHTCILPDGAIDGDGIAPTVMVMLLLVTVRGEAQPRDEVITQLTASPSESVVEAKLLPVPDGVLPTSH